MKAFLPILLECLTLSKLSGFNIQLDNVCTDVIKKNIWLNELPFDHLLSFFTLDSIVLIFETLGHCKKFFMILEKCSIIMEQNDYKWLLVVDDDTLVRYCIQI